MAPVTFLQTLLCLGPGGRRDGRLRRSAPLRRARHPSAVGRRARTCPPRSSLDVAIADAGKVGAAAARGRRAGHGAAGRAEAAVGDRAQLGKRAAGARRRAAAAAGARGSRARCTACGSRASGSSSGSSSSTPFHGVRAATPTGGTVEYERPAGLYSASADGDPALARPKPFLQGFALPFDPLRVDTPPRARVGAARARRATRSCRPPRAAAAGARSRSCARAERA